MSNKELVARLIKENEEFRVLHEEHIEFERQIEELKKKKPQDNRTYFEIETLKKKKLKGKDKMELILTKHR